MKLTMECLVDINTGKPLEIEISDSYENYMTNIAPLQQAAWESGRRFRRALTQNEKTNEQS
jgi:hypothetical protein